MHSLEKGGLIDSFDLGWLASGASQRRACPQEPEKQPSFNRFAATVSLLEAQTMHGIRKQPGCRARLGEVESGRGKSPMGGFGGKTK